MKYTTFRNLMAVVGLALVGGSFYACYQWSGSDAGSSKPAALTSSGRLSEAEMMRAFLAPATGDKRKDVFPASGTKVNFYADNGAPQWTRAKIDYDRDEQDDEKWDRDLATGQIQRRVSPNDDGQYGAPETWDGSAFVAAGAAIAPRPAPTPAPTPAPDGVAADARPLDQRIVSFLAANPATSDKIKDAFPGESAKVNLYRDAGQASWNRLKIDLDRDEKWDEKWDLENGQPAKRHVSPADDDNYTQEFRWRGGKWEEKK